MITFHLLTLVIASSLDFLIGDPWGYPHPVRVMGWAIARSTKIILSTLKTPVTQKLAGVCLTLGLMGISASIGWSLIQVGYYFSSVIGLITESILLATCFAGRSLRDAALAILMPLQANNIPQARETLSLYVGRDTEQLESPEILRAVLETVAENCTDGVIAPLFYALIGGAPLALAYKALSTLDSMIGYKEAPYTNLGWCSAKLEDVLSWLPCRYTVLSIALLSGHPFQVWQLCQRDAPKDISPNSGWSECAFAAALGVQLGGTNTYKGIVKDKPLLAEPKQPITPLIIKQALQLMRFSFLILLGLGCLTIWLVNFTFVKN